MRGFSGLGARVVLSKFWSFDCAKASAVIDKMICSSEVLRIFDTEIARAFGALLARQGLSVKDEQRRFDTKVAHPQSGRTHSRSTQGSL